MKHAKRCGGRLVTLVERRVTLSSGHERVTVECERCGERFPFGPSDEAPVAVEVRAAELAAEWTPERGTSDGASLGEDIGWLMRAARGDIDHQPGTDAHHAGYLAHAIAHHDEEQTAGQALSDGGTTEGA